MHRRRGQLEIAVPDSEESAIRVMLPGRAVTVAPGETRAFLLPED